jgi:multicomponent K+:H+ antiporter subunit G
MMIVDLILSALLVIGGLFGLLGSFGLLKLKDTMQRLHAPTKATTVGVGAALVVSMLYALTQGRVSWHELLITLFLLLTAPITGNLLAKAHLHSRMQKQDLPPTGVTDDWATFDRDGPSRLLPDLNDPKS